MTVNAVRKVTINPYSYSGTYLYGYSNGTYDYGTIDDQSLHAIDGTVMRLNAVRYYTGDTIPDYYGVGNNYTGATIYLRFDGFRGNSGFTDLVIQSQGTASPTTYSRASGVYVGGNGGGGQLGGTLYSSWKWPAPSNPFSTTQGHIDTVTFTNMYSQTTAGNYGAEIFDYDGNPVITMNTALAHFHDVYTVTIAANQTTGYTPLPTGTDYSSAVAIIIEHLDWQNSIPTTDQVTHAYVSSSTNRVYLRRGTATASSISRTVHIVTGV